MKLCSNPNSRVTLLLGNYSSPTNYISGYYISSAALNDNSVSPLYAGKGNKKKSPRQSVKLIFHSRAGIFQEDSKDSFSYLESNRSASITRHLKRLRCVR